MNRYLSLFLLSFFVQFSFAQDQVSPWDDVNEEAFMSKGERVIQPEKYRTLRLEEQVIRQQLATAPLEGTMRVAQSPTIIELPMPDGEFARFQIIESPIMAAPLAAKYPSIKTYAGKGLDDRSALLRFDLTNKGFHAMVLSSKGDVFIDPYFRKNDGHYISYKKSDFKTQKNFTCLVGEKHAPSTETLRNGPTPVGDELRTYRLAVSATGEYSLYHGTTKAEVLAAIVTSMNRINGIYERDLSVRMELIANNDTLIYLDPATDPFNGDELSENQASTDAAIGNANYDIGHVFDRGGGGVAILGSVCSSTVKAQGYTSQNPPVGDPMDIDYVSHEMGHQFNGNHTFNNCNGQGALPYEPGSAITIMGYAGLCGANDLSSNSIAQFHVGNFDEMAPFTLTGGGNNCPVTTINGNTPPSVDAGASGYIIPISTPFELIGSGTDIDGDSLTYCWEQFDLGPSTPVNAPAGNAPAFRSFLPSNDSIRVFPKIQDILFNTQSTGERLPTYSRDMTFRLTVRDNNLGGGGVDYDEMTMSATDQAGPFVVTSQSTSTQWLVGEYALIQWNVAGTDVPPINCQSVDIYLSVDDGYTYPILLATGVPNNGVTSITVPNFVGTARRVKVKASDNVFFNINTSLIEIVEPTEADFSLIATTPSQLVCLPSDAVVEVSMASLLGFNEPVDLTVSGNPDGTTVSISSTPVTPAGNSTITIGNTSGLSADSTYTMTITGTSATQTHTIDVEFSVYEAIPNNLALVSPVDGAVNEFIRPVLDWDVVANAEYYTVELATDMAFTNLVFSQVGVVEDSIALPFDLEDATTFYWRVKGTNPGCGDGAYSPVFSFTTEALICETYFPTDLPILITDVGTPTIASQLIIEDSVVIRDINVLNLSGQHTWINDLDFTLRSPSGTSVVLIPQVCNSENDFDLSLDDESALDQLPCSYNDGQTYQPSGSLADFDGEMANGTWTLIVNDNFNADGGSLDSWSIEICSPAPIINAVEAFSEDNNGVRVYPNPATDVLTMEVTLKHAMNAKVRLLNAAGQLVHESAYENLFAGEHYLTFNVEHLAAGVYFYQILDASLSSNRYGKFVVKR